MLILICHDNLLKFDCLVIVIALGSSVVLEVASSGQAQLEPVPEETEVVEESRPTLSHNLTIRVKLRNRTLPLLLFL